MTVTDMPDMIGNYNKRINKYVIINHNIYCLPFQEKRELIVEELVETERQYVETLQKLVDVSISC